MTAEEAKKCLYSKQAVICNDVRYDEISAIIYRLDNNKNIMVSAELLDKSKRSVVIARIKDVQIVEG